MTSDSATFDVNDPDVFSRGSLKLTYDLIRKRTPQLALKVRNIIGGEPLSSASSQTENKHADYFRVCLGSFEVRSVVEGLMEQQQSGLGGAQPTGMAVLAASLIDEWLALARQMFAELPDNQKP